MCDTNLQLLQQGDTSAGGGGLGEGASGNANLEVLREGSLLKKGGIGQQFKPRHFVCTRAGFLHYFDSKFDLNPKGSIPLYHARVSIVQDDACALAIESADGSPITPSPASAMMKNFMGKSSKNDRLILRSALGSTDRDEWIATLSACSRASQD